MVRGLYLTSRVHVFQNVKKVLLISMKSECAGVRIIPAGVCVCVLEQADRVMEQIKLSCGRR